MTTENLFTEISNSLPDELIETIGGTENMRIERIVSRGHTTPDDYWYDQEETEFVMVIQGKTRLLFDGEDAERELIPGDYLTIPPHTKHRVTWTTPNDDSIWLAVFYCTSSNQ